MILLLDTHILLWAAYEPEKLGAEARSLCEAPGNTLVFSAASIWEVAIKAARRREDFTVDPRVLRRGLVESGYVELPVRADHAAEVADLPAIHRDPFDRVLVAQARIEGVTLLTSDATVGRYGPPVRMA